MSNNKLNIIGNNNTQSLTQIFLDSEYINTMVSFPNNPKTLNSIVFMLYESMSDENMELETRSLHPQVELKLEHNNIIKYKILIEENYCENAFYIDEVYKSLDSDAPGKKRMFLKFIRNLYTEILGDFLSNNSGKDIMLVVKENSDKMFAMILAELFKKISVDTKKLENLSQEEISIAIFVIVTHAFVECKILENPNN